MRRVLSFLFQRIAMAGWLGGGVFLAATTAQAQFVVSDPVTEASTTASSLSTAASHVTQVLQYANDIQRALTIAQHLMLMQREVQQLVQHPSTNFLQDLNMVSGILQQSQGLALNVAQISQTFSNQLAPYSPNPVLTYASQYNTWANTALKALNGAAQVNGAQGNMMNGQQTVFMNQMSGLIGQPTGLDQGIQITNALNFELVQQMQRMNAANASTASASMAAMTAQLNHQQTSINAQTAFIENSGATNTDVRVVDPITGVH